MQIYIINHVYGGHSRNLVMLYDIYRFLCACVCTRVQEGHSKRFVKHELSFLSIIILVSANTRFFILF